MQRLGYFFIKKHRQITRPSFINDDNDVFLKMREWVMSADYNNGIIDKLKIKEMGFNVNFAKTVYKYGEKFSEDKFDHSKKYVIKHSNGSGFLKIVYGSEINEKTIQKLYKKWNVNANLYGFFQKEGQYIKNDGTLFIEEFVGEDIFDYKIHYFNESEYQFLISSGKKGERVFLEYDKNFNSIYDDTSSKMSRPITDDEKRILKICLEKTKEISNKVGNHYGRYDYFYVNNEIYLSEITLTSGAGRIFNKFRTNKKDMSQIKNQYEYFYRNYMNANFSERCNICGEETSLFGVTQRKRDSIDGKEYFNTILNCKKCQYRSQKYFNVDRNNLVYKNYVVNNEAAGKNEGGKLHRHHYRLKEQQKKQIEMFDHILKNLTNGRIVEIGCSSGFNLETMRELNPKNNYVGYDLDVLGVEFGRKITKLDLRNEDFFSDNSKYDLIFLSHTIEHVEDPVSFMNKLKNKLSDGGNLIITVPDGYDYLEIPTWEHLNYFSPCSLAKIGKIIEMKSDIKRYHLEKRGSIDLIAIYSMNGNLSFSDEVSDLISNKYKRIGARNWYESGVSVNEKKIAEKHYAMSRKGRRWLELLMWSKLWRMFNPQNKI